MAAAVNSAAEREHTRDEDCTLDSDGLCIECGVSHVETCPDCGGHGFHRDGCPELAPATDAVRPRAGQLVRVEVARGWRAARVLCERDPENDAFLVAVDARGHVWRMVNPACVRVVDEARSMARARQARALHDAARVA